MLTPEDFEKIAKQAEKIYSELELEIIQEIAERIANVGYANTVVLNDILIAQEMGLMYQDIINLVAKYNETSVSQIQEIFDTAGAQTLKFDDKVYKEAGLSPLPLKQSPSMIQLLSATALKTHNNLSNLVMTTANTSQTEFYNAMNKAYMEVSTGVKSYSQSILDTVKELSDKGAYITYPSGQHRSIESAVRMNIITSVNQTCGRLQEMRADELGWDLMELTAHAGARPEHAEWQGRIVSRSGQKGYLSLEDIGYGEATGFKGVNCRHDWRPYYKGSSLTYSNSELKEMKNATVNYNGKGIPQYQAEQMQRAMERKIRQDRKDIAGLQGILTSNNKDDKLIEDTKTQLANAQIKLKQHNSILNEFTKQTGLIKDKSRLATVRVKQKNDNIIKNVKTINIGSLEKTLGKEHTFKIQKTLESASENIKKVWNNFIDKININDIHYKGTAHYSWGKNGIYIDLDKISKDRLDEFVGKKEKEIYKKAYGTLYHETGHHISSIFSRSKGKNIDVSEWFESQKHFKEQLTKDGGKVKVGYTLDEMVRKEGWDYIDNTLKEMRTLAKEQGQKATSVNATQVYQKTIKDLRSMSVLEQHDISDMFDGITNGKVWGYTQHSYSTKNYWKTHGVGSEAFAEMFDATINNSKSLKRIKEYFPKSYEIFEEIIQEMGG